MQTVNREQLKKMMDKDKTMILAEVLPLKNYHKYHIAGAVSLPLNERFEDQFQKIIPDKNRSVVLYCSNSGCQASEEASRRVEEAGYTNVYDYKDGKEDWKEAGLPVETGS